MDPLGAAASCVTLIFVSERAIHLCNDFRKLPQVAQKLRKKMLTNIRHMKQLEKKINEDDDFNLTSRAKKMIKKTEDILARFRDNTMHFLRWDTPVERTTWDKMRCWLAGFRKRTEFSIFSSRLKQYSWGVERYRKSLEKACFRHKVDLAHRGYELHQAAVQSKKATPPCLEVPRPQPECLQTQPVVNLQSAKENSDTPEETETKTTSACAKGAAVGALALALSLESLVAV
ncbi:hypothetical protein QQZ08_005238 [Neonectria magnoliae]|uniref:Uncharacterized protein n=1 Tax=Neonectria magnoliae TaxID=2732573 RepID=A0ABR1I3R4_9HYPO